MLITWFIQKQPTVKSESSVLARITRHELLQAKPWTEGCSSDMLGSDIGAGVHEVTY